MLADAFAAVYQASAEAIEPDPRVDLDVWAEANVVVPKGSAFPGPFRLEKTPYARRLLQALSPSHPAKYIVARVASQLMKTQTFICAALGWIALAPANILALEPNKTVTQRLSNRLEEAIRACPSVTGRVAKPRSRDSRNTLEDKQFDGGHLYILTAGSDANLAEVPLRYLFCDEINRENWVTGAKEGDRVRIAIARLTSYGDSGKAYIVSSPTLQGASPITDWFERGTQEHYEVPCPHCGHHHELKLENFKHFKIGDVVTRAWFVCPECAAEIEEYHKPTMFLDEVLGGSARWVASSQGDGETISVALSAFYAPIGSISWLALAREYAEAAADKEKGNHEKAIVFWNTRLGLDYDRTEESSTVQELMQRSAAEGLPPRVIPDRALVITMYADTQPNRLEVVVEAWGPGMEHWTIDDRVLWGSPSAPPETPGSCWQQLDELRRTPYMHESGVEIRFSAYGIDSGGANTQDVYNYGGQREALSCVVTKGASVAGKAILAQKPTPQDIDWQGQKKANGVRLWLIGTDTAKDWLHNRIKLLNGPGAAHWCTGLEEDFFDQLLAERPEISFRRGRPVRAWVKPNGARNEKHDCAVGNLALAHYLDLPRWSALDWQKLRDNLIPKDRPPKALPAPVPAAAVIAAQPSNRGRRVISRGLA